MTNIILCGGSGTRLWPISRTAMPKQFVKIIDNVSLFQFTLQRNLNIVYDFLIVSNEDQYFVAIDQIDEVSPEIKYSTILEPIGRNTAPAIALACFGLDRDSIVLVTPSDHLIKNFDNYLKSINEAKNLAENGYLVTFGILPNFPETGFGYIEADGSNVLAFHEKPSLEIAEKYIKSGNYYWNSGMFCFKVGVFLDELKKHSPDIFSLSKMAYDNSKKETVTRINLNDMLNIPEDSIDYAVMEKSSIVKVVKTDMEWSDVGSFDALYEELPKDDYGNTQNTNHISIDSKNNLIFGHERKIATIDIDDFLIVDTADALLISKRGSSQKVKKAVNKIKEDTQLHNVHLTVHRPWGTYTVLEEQPGYKIKKIVVKPGKRLSLQKHSLRSEHWIVVHGIATVTVGEKVQIISANESTYIKPGEVHRLANDGQGVVELIEVQVGDYTGEDDIIRLDDDYLRSY